MSEFTFYLWSVRVGKQLLLSSCVTAAGVNFACARLPEEFKPSPRACSCLCVGFGLYIAVLFVCVHVTVYCVVLTVYLHCSEVLSFLTCTTLIKALAILSWLPLITATAWALPGLLCFPPSPIPLEDYSRVPPALPAWLSSTSHIDRAVIKHCFFSAYLPTGGGRKKRRRGVKKKIIKLFILVSSPSVFRSGALDTL